MYVGVSMMHEGYAVSEKAHGHGRTVEGTNGERTNEFMKGDQPVVRTHPHVRVHN
jgi:hypothetical protein